MSAKYQRHTCQNILSNTFYQLPKFLFDAEFKGLSNDARVLYSLLRNRHEISVKNGWYDKNNEVYIYFKREDMQTMLDLSDKTVAKAMKDLKSFSLLEEIKQGLGKPNRIYLLMATDTSQDAYKRSENPQTPQTRRNYDSRGAGSANQETQDIHSGHNEIINDGTTRTMRPTQPYLSNQHVDMQGDLGTRQGNGKPNIINLSTAASAYHGIGESTENRQTSQTSKFYDSGTVKLTGQEPQNLRPNYKELKTNITSPVLSSQSESGPAMRKQTDETDTAKTMQMIKDYTALIKSNIGYDDLADEIPHDMALVDDFIAIIIDNLLTKSATIRIAGEDKPRALVQNQLLKLKQEDIEYAIHKYESVNMQIKKKKLYILTMLYNCTLERNARITNAVSVMCHT